jgi:Zn-dependent metalloprotease
VNLPLTDGGLVSEGGGTVSETDRQEGETMGDFFEGIVDVEVTGEEAGPLAERMVDWMVTEGLITRELSSEGVYSLTEPSP